MENISSAINISNKKILIIMLILCFIVSVLSCILYLNKHLLNSIIPIMHNDIINNRREFLYSNIDYEYKIHNPDYESNNIFKLIDKVELNYNSVSNFIASFIRKHINIMYVVRTEKLMLIHKLSMQDYTSIDSGLERSLYTKMTPFFISDICFLFEHSNQNTQNNTKKNKQYREYPGNLHYSNLDIFQEVINMPTFMKEDPRNSNIESLIEKSMENLPEYIYEEQADNLRTFLPDSLFHPLLYMNTSYF